MKKVLAICLALVMVVSMSLTVLAVPNNFVQSPPAEPTGGLVDFETDVEDCIAWIAWTDFSDRDNLKAELLSLMEEAYNMIINAKDLGELNPALYAMARALGVSIEDFYVSDLFDLSREGCTIPHDHGHFDLEIKAEYLEHFVCLLHYYNGEWEIIEDAEVTHDGMHLEFTVTDFSPFAIVVNLGTPADNPPTGDDSNIGLYAAIMGASGLALIVLWIASKKQHSK